MVQRRTPNLSVQSCFCSLQRSPSHGQVVEADRHHDEDEYHRRRNIEFSRQRYGSVRSLPDRRMSSSTESLQGPSTSAEFCNRQRSCSAGMLCLFSLCAMQGQVKVSVV